MLAFVNACIAFMFSEVLMPELLGSWNIADAYFARLE